VAVATIGSVVTAFAKAETGVRTSPQATPCHSSFNDPDEQLGNKPTAAQWGELVSPASTSASDPEQMEVRILRLAAPRPS